MNFRSNVRYSDWMTRLVVWVWGQGQGCELGSILLKPLFVLLNPLLFWFYFRIPQVLVDKTVHYPLILFSLFLKKLLSLTTPYICLKWKKPRNITTLWHIIFALVSLINMPQSRDISVIFPLETYIGVVNDNKFKKKTKKKLKRIERGIQCTVLSTNTCAV